MTAEACLVSHLVRVSMGVNMYISLDGSVQISFLARPHLTVCRLSLGEEIIECS